MRTESQATLKAQETRERLGIKTGIRSTYVKPLQTQRKFRCIDGEIFRLNESTGKYEKYDYMENIPGTCLKK